MAWTRHVLLNMAPNDSVKPTQNTHVFSYTNSDTTPTCTCDDVWHATVNNALLHTNHNEQCGTGFGRHGMPPPVCNPDLGSFDLETSERVAFTVGNIHSKIGHARPLGSLCTWRTDRQTDGRTDIQTDGQKQRLLPLPYGQGHNNALSPT